MERPREGYRRGGLYAACCCSRRGPRRRSDGLRAPRDARRDVEITSSRTSNGSSSFPPIPGSPSTGGSPKTSRSICRRCSRGGSAFHAAGAEEVLPQENALAPQGRHAARLRLSRHRDRPDAGVRRNRRLRAHGHTRSICHVDACQRQRRDLGDVLPRSRPHRRRRGPGRLLLRARLRIRVDWRRSCGGGRYGIACR